MDLSTLFTGVTVGELFPRARSITVFNEGDKTIDCLTRLDQENILSAPVVNQDGQIIGIVDVLDIALFILGLFPKDIPVQNVTTEDLAKVLATGERFESTPVGTVLEVSEKIKSGYEHVFSIKQGDHMSKLLEMFFEGVHRVVLLADDDVTVLNIISQSDALGVLAQCMPLLAERERKQTVSQLGLSVNFDTAKKITSCLPTDKTISVLAKMNADINKPILSAVPIVDSNGTLVGNFSASNLKGLRKASFSNLLLPVVDFLVLQFNTGSFLHRLSNAKSLHPITCNPSTTFEDLVCKMVAHKVHRLWVTEDGKEAGIVSTGDVFKVFIPWAKKQKE